ncbi:lipoic acid synthetase [Parelusimicrobium proximum]|uniref:lipoyl synthase n=1 Tax=Parelusimicrobium proximum TaxID=3228953 RepID=UPI003D181545
MRETIPTWLKKMVGDNKARERNASSSCVSRALSENSLNTVCYEAKCPNRGHCFSKGDATFMILGSICTRGCKFCAVCKGAPKPIDKNEAAKIAQTVKNFNLKYIVLTSPTRDDLADGGAQHFYDVITEIKNVNAGVRVEPLIPDFKGDYDALNTVLSAKPEVLAHNIETVPSLYKDVRIGADYKRSLELIRESKRQAPHVLTKSGIMLGLGETNEELKETITDLLAHGCDILTLGQYLAPSGEHNIVKRYPEPAEYDELKDFALKSGFKAVASGPLVRSSYDAGDLYKEAKIMTI